MIILTNNISIQSSRKENVSSTGPLKKALETYGGLLPGVRPVDESFPNRRGRNEPLIKSFAREPKQSDSLIQPEDVIQNLEEATEAVRSTLKKETEFVNKDYLVEQGGVYGPFYEIKGADNNDTRTVYTRDGKVEEGPTP